MGHRALLAYRREADDDSTAGTDSDDHDPPDADSTDAESMDADPTDAEATDADPEDARYDLHRSHWGGADFALLDSLSAEEPFATDTHVAVDPEPVATDLAIAEIAANYLDFLHHEAFYRVGAEYETTAYHVLWFGLEADCEAVARSETVGHGALVEAHPDDADYLRGWFRGTKSVVGEMVDRGALAPGESPELASGTDPPRDSDDGESATETATDYLAERAETWAADREVILPD